MCLSFVLFFFSLCRLITLAAAALFFVSWSIRNTAIRCFVSKLYIFYCYFMFFFLIFVVLHSRWYIHFFFFLSSKNSVLNYVQTLFLYLFFSLWYLLYNNRCKHTDEFYFHFLDPHFIVQAESYTNMYAWKKKKKKDASSHFKLKK